jgi:hypothetical protein
MDEGGGQLRLEVALFRETFRRRVAADLFRELRPQRPIHRSLRGFAVVEFYALRIRKSSARAWRTGVERA